MSVTQLGHTRFLHVASQKLCKNICINTGGFKTLHLNNTFFFTQLFHHEAEKQSYQVSILKKISEPRSFKRVCVKQPKTPNTCMSLRIPHKELHGAAKACSRHGAGGMSRAKFQLGLLLYVIIILLIICHWATEQVCLFEHGLKSLANPTRKALW